MTTNDRNQKLLRFFEQHPTAVIATSDLKGNPAAAVVLFSAQDDLALIFGTHPTKKYDNLRTNPRVALVMTRGMQAVQYHGYVEELNGNAAAEARNEFGKKHPDMDQHLVDGTVFFRVRPTWIRFQDMGVQPWEMWEVTFPAPDWFHR